MPKANCQFRGTGGQYFATVFIHLFILTFITLGIYSAWAWARLFRLKASHTTINGKSVTFTGTGGQLFVLVLVQGLITVITFGLYFPWAICKFFSWKAENTLIGGEPSEFTGTGGSLFLFYLIHLLILPMLTLGLYYLWGLYRFYAWKEEHTRYGGEKTSFGAGFGGFLRVSLVSYILNALTLSLFTPWAISMLFKWQVNGLAVGDEPGVEHFPPVKTNLAVVTVLIVIGLTPVVAIGLFVKNKLGEVQKFQLQMARTQMEALRRQKTYKVPHALSQTTKRPVHRARPRVIPRPAPSLNALQPKDKPTPKEVVDYETQMRKLNNMIKLGSKDADAFYNRGWLHAYKGNLQFAEKDYTRAVNSNKRHADAYYNRGLLYVKMRDYQKAAKDFAEVIALDSRAVDAYCNRGNAQFQMGKPDLALKDFDAALKIDPKDGDLYYNRAVVYLSKNDNQRATANFRKAAMLGQEEAKRYLAMGGAKRK